MVLPRLFYLLLAITPVLCIESRDRRVHRLVGGHIRITNPTADDAELLDALPSNSKERNFKDKKSGEEKNNAKDEEKKTLSQQVADGKYGLIQRELFRKPLKQPGIISYDPNPEIPKDNINNLGGLSKEDIWLSENHLLVLRGGNYPKHDDKFDNTASIWPAIDNYTAPKRPVKLPSNPKVPPPFPVQLTEDGPLQILGSNSSGTLDGPPNLYAVPPPEGYVPGTGPFFPQDPYPTHLPAGGTSNQNSAKTPGEGERGPPFPPFLNGTSPPSFAYLPPGAMAVAPPPEPPSINDFDEDDPSIYYPPPYSFFYPREDNSSLVPAGPLVPGIILPPPPDFFAPLETPSTSHKTQRPKTNTMRPTKQKTIQQSDQIRPTTTPIIPTTVLNFTLRKPIKVVSNNPKDSNNELKRVNVKQPVVKINSKPSTRPYSSTRLQSSRPHTKRPAVTILKPVKPNDSHRTYYNQNTGKVSPFAIYGPPKTTTQKTIVTSTQEAPKQYYSTPDDYNSNIVTVTPERGTPNPIQYYDYEEEPQTNSITTPRPKQIIQNFYRLPEEYIKSPKSVRPVRPQYVYVTSKPLINTPRPNYNNFNVHLEKLKKQIQYYTSPKPVFREIHQPRPVYQYSFQAANYKSQRQNNFRPSRPDTAADDGDFRPMPKYSVQIQPSIDISTHQPAPQNPIYFKQSYAAPTERPADSQPYYTTTRPSFTYRGNSYGKGRNIQKAKLVAEYSFEAAPNNDEYRGGQDNYNDNVNNNNQFITFGRRLPTHTTPVPAASSYSTKSPDVVYVTANNNGQSQHRPPSLEGDTLVNYINPHLNINPNAEFIPVKIHKQINYPQTSNYYSRPNNRYNPNAQQQPSNNNRPQIVNAIPIKILNEDADKGSFISYSLPGDNGAHFYFLTPQLAQSREQGSGFYYSKADSDRIRRNSGGGDSER